MSWVLWAQIASLIVISGVMVSAVCTTVIKERARAAKGGPLL